MEILYHNSIDINSLSKKFYQTLENLKSGNFLAADVKKMPETNLYRAKLDYSSRLIFRFAKYDGQTYLLLLEIISNHDYGKSKFLRGVNIDETKLNSLQHFSVVDAGQITNLTYINPKQKQFHLLDKIISFDDEQNEVLYIQPPLILIGSAGSGKTALALEKIKSLSGNILYVTLSPYLAEHAARLYYSYHYENEMQEIDFLSFREFLETIRIPEGKKMGFKDFEQWFLPHRHHSGIKDAHKLFEELSGVITGHSVEKEYLSREDYLNLGIKQSIFLNEERNHVYDLFEKYLLFLKERKYYDINIISNQWVKLCQPHYDFIIVDEVQDYTNIQLFLILKSLKLTGNFILCGDSNQIVHPNFFSWSKVKTMFYHHFRESNITRVLTTNYRNSPQVTEIANRLLKIKNARFGSIDRESTYLIRTISARKGEVLLLEDSDKVKTEFNQKTRQSTRFAVLVMRNEDKAEASKYFNTPLLFSVQEAKGLEYENILLFNFVSENSQVFREITSDITLQNVTQEEITYSRASDKTDKSLEAYKFYINTFFVAMTRAVGNLYIIEKNHKQELLSLLELNVTSRQLNLQQQVSSKDEWQREAQRLEKQGRSEQAELIRKTILGTQTVPWEILTLENLKKLQEDAFHPDFFNKKAKDKLFDYALIYNDESIIRQLIKENYKRAEHPKTEQNSLLRRVYVNYVGESPKLIMPLINKYGVDFRNEFNQTPLMIAAWTGSAGISGYLLALGAKTELIDNIGKNALQTSLLQSYRLHDYAKNKLGKIYPLVVNESMNVKIDDRLIKINNHQAEFLLLNLLIAIQKELTTSGDLNKALGFTASELAGIFENYPDNVLQPYRKQQQYISSVLAKNEVLKESIYNKKLFLRLERGYYVLNPELEIQVSKHWFNIYELMQTEKMTHEQNIKMMITRWEEVVQSLSEREEEINETIQKERQKANPYYDKIDDLRELLYSVNRQSENAIEKINELKKKQTLIEQKSSGSGSGSSGEQLSLMFDKK